MQFNCASANFKFEQSLDRSATIKDIKETIERMNINQGKAVSLHYNNVERQDNETLAQIGYNPATTVDIHLTDAQPVSVENPNPFDANQG